MRDVFGLCVLLCNTFSEVGSNALQIVLAVVVLMQHTSQFYSSTFGKEKSYFYSVILNYILLATYIFIYLLLHAQPVVLVC